MSDVREETGRKIASGSKVMAEEQVRERESGSERNHPSGGALENQHTIASGDYVETGNTIVSGDSLEVGTAIASGPGLEVGFSTASGVTHETGHMVASSGVEIETGSGEVSDSLDENGWTLASSGNSVETGSNLTSGNIVEIGQAIASGSAMETENPGASDCGIETGTRNVSGKALENGDSMAHRILGERFYAKRGQPVWHGLGERGDVDESAQSVMTRIADYDVTVEPLYTEIGGQRIEVPERVVMRHPVTEDNQYRSFGVVGKDFQMLTPQFIASIWDEHVGRPVETMELLATTRATGDLVRPVLFAAWPSPTPPPPREDCPPEVFTQRFEKYEADVQIVQERRITALDLFRGDGTGMGLDSRKGTMWGVYQAVAELEQYRRGGNDQSAATSMLVGSRGATVQRAFDAALEACRSN